MSTIFDKITLSEKFSTMIIGNTERINTVKNSETLKGIIENKLFLFLTYTIL